MDMSQFVTKTFNLQHDCTERKHQLQNVVFCPDEKKLPDDSIMDYGANLLPNEALDSLNFLKAPL